MKFLKGMLFTLITLMVLFTIGVFMKPVWRDWNNYDTTQGFYDQPENTIETVFLGASIVVDGITPTELYEDYGICAYNLATEQQPMLASYYWAREAYRLHSETLDTIVIDASMFRRTPTEAFYQKALDGMKMSLNKWEAVGAYTDSLQEQISYFVPLFEYHSRWTNLGKGDFNKELSDVKTFVRGYNFSDTLFIENENYNNIEVPEYTLDTEADETDFNDESLYYLKQLIDFCNNYGIRLVIIRTPGIGYWSSENHNAVEKIAEQYGVDFLDFNYDPLYSEIEFNEATDSIDGNHMNYYGAQKLTAYLGKYLVENCGNRDVRGTAGFSFMDEESEEYQEFIEIKAGYKSADTAADFLKAALNNQDNVVFITVKDDAAVNLTDDQRKLFKNLGLKTLSEIGYRDSYIGIIDNEGVVTEICENNPEEKAEETTDERNNSQINDLENIDLSENTIENEPLYLDYEGELDNNTKFELKSGGTALGSISSCIINNIEYSANSRGINYVVYNKTDDEVIFSRTYDTYSYSKEYGYLLDEYNEAGLEENISDSITEKVEELYLYNRKCEIEKEVSTIQNNRTDDGVLYYLNYWCSRDNTAVYISVLDDAATGLDDAARKYLKKLNFVQLSDIQYRDSYIGIFFEGDVIYEQTDHGTLPIEKEDIGYDILSGGTDSGNVSSIIVNDVEYSCTGRGMNIVVYDTILKEVIDTESFDTCIYPATIPSKIKRTGGNK